MSRKFNMMLHLVWLALFSMSIHAQNPDYQSAMDAFNQQEFKKSAEIFTKIIDSGDAQVMNPSIANRGICYFYLGHYDKALKDYNKVIDMNPQFMHSFDNRGVLYMKMGKFKEALDDFMHVVENEDENFSAYKNMAYLLACCPDKKIRNGEKAVEFAEDAYELQQTVDSLSMGFYDENKPWQYVAAIAAAHAENGNFDKAVEHQTKAMDMLKSEEYSDEKAKKAFTEEAAKQMESYKNKKAWRIQVAKKEMKKEKSESKTEAKSDDN